MRGGNAWDFNIRMNIRSGLGVFSVFISKGLWLGCLGLNIIFINVGINQ